MQNYLLQLEISIDQNVITHQRVRYGFLMLIGDLGGVLGIIISFLAILVEPYSQLSFKLKRLRKMFIVNSKS
jgi:hypothetical protein